MKMNEKNAGVAMAAGRSFPGMTSNARVVGRRSKAERKTASISARYERNKKSREAKKWQDYCFRVTAVSGS